MPDVSIKEWLQTWVEDNIRPQGHIGRKSDMLLEVDTCRATARNVGISVDALDKAAGGDLAAFFMRQQNRSTDIEDASTAERQTKHPES